MINLERILNYYETKHFHLQNPHQVKSGKEATVFVANFGIKPLALKVYIDPEIRAFKNNQLIWKASILETHQKEKQS